jgi:hypothetical protein
VERESEAAEMGPVCFGGGGSGACDVAERKGRGGSGPVGGRVEGMAGAMPPERVSVELSEPVGGRTAGGGSGPERGGAESGPVEARLGMIGSVPESRRGGTGAVGGRLAGAVGAAGPGLPPTEAPGLDAGFRLTRRENFS